MKLIKMEKVLGELCLSHKDIIYIDKNETAERIRKIPSVETKQIKYFDEDEKVWKIGEAIVDGEREGE